MISASLIVDDPDFKLGFTKINLNVLPRSGDRITVIVDNETFYLSVMYIVFITEEVSRDWDEDNTPELEESYDPQIHAHLIK